jgi:hypothetical protein
MEVFQKVVILAPQEVGEHHTSPARGKEKSIPVMIWKGLLILGGFLLWCHIA